MQRKKIKLGMAAILFGSLFLFGQEQNSFDLGEIHGNFQTDFQYYVEDTLIGAPPVEEQFLLNAFLNLTYTRNKFSAGMRYEVWQNALLGYDRRYKGNGMPFRYARYNSGFLDITLGNFYEQFGSGVILRTNEEWGLGFDNSIDGLRTIFRLKDGTVIKGVIGQQRFYFSLGEGIVRGFDVKLPISDYAGWEKSHLELGGSFVSKFQEDLDPRYNLPKNVGSWAGRLQFRKGGFQLFSEYAYKINDPSTLNNFIYKDGQALITTATFSGKGFGIILASKRLYNMHYRSDRTAILNDLMINFLPAYTFQHTYTLPALYPYATQPNGEVGYQAELNYKIKRGSALGGKYGTDIRVNYSIVHAIPQTELNDTTPLYSPGTDGYDVDFWGWGEERYFRDFNIALSRRINKKMKALLTYINVNYNKEIIEGKPGFIYMQSGIIELQYKLKPRHTLRSELQAMFIAKDKGYRDRGDWIMILLEYTISPNWFFTFQDSYNYGNPDPIRRVHYYMFSAGYASGASRIQVNYGKQQEGIFCVGGVCRNVPASNGLSFSISTSF
jgi:hypothetical protein